MSAIKGWTSQEVRFYKYPTHEIFKGTREGLLEAGIARPEWFARLGEIEQTGRRRGRRVRRWRFSLETGERVLLAQERPNWFYLSVSIEDPDELERRSLLYQREGEFGRIRLKPIRAAREDAAFQRFMARAMARPQ